MIYEKTLEVQSDSDDDLSAVTLMSTEVDNISIGIQNAHETWASPIELAIAIYLLEREVIWAAAVPAAISLIVFYLTGLISKSFPTRQATWMQAVRERVAFTSNWLDMSKAVKMLGISEPVSRIAQQLRVQELNLQKKFRRSFVTMNLVAGIPSNLGPAITLAVYTGVAFWTGRDPLTESQTFTALSVIVLASNPLSNLVYSAPRVAGVIESFQRIQKFLLQTSRHDYRGSIRSHINLQEVPEIMACDSISTSFEMEYITTREGMQSKAKPASDTADVVVVQKADFSSNRTTSVLSNISLRLSRGSLTLVVGPVGSGKSMLLKAILGELQCTQGYEQMQTSLKVGYCDAHSWVRNKTVQENILGPLEYDDEWYKTIVRACALKDDIESLPQGHHTLIGSNGTSVSGGQRQRIAIAHALYARTQLALFDDVLSALDARTSEHILTHVFGNHGLLRKHGVTVVLVTHRLRESNELILMDTIPSGVAQGTISSSPVNSQQPAVPPSHAVEDIADRKLGDLTNYSYYLKTAGTGNILLYFMCLIVGAFCSQFPNLWVQWWAQTNARSPFEQLATYISVYAMLAIFGSALWAWCMWLVFCRIVPKTSGRLHEYLVTKTNDAPLSFLTSTDNGTTLNRFSQDMTLGDRSLPADFLKTSNNFVQCLMSAIFISGGAKYLAPLIPVAGFVVYLIQTFYLRTSRQLRQLDLETKSPLYTQFTETISGLTTIRAFGWQRYFQDELQKLLHTSQRPFFTLFVVQRWLILVLDLFVAGVAILLCLLAVMVPNIGPIGVSLISLVTFSQQLAELINFWTSMETSIGAITRIRKFQNTVPSENLPGEDQIPPPTWPSEGRLVFRNVSAGYTLATQPVLRNIAFTVEPGTKLGICGRTGSGKSSLILAILRLIEVQSGDITIDHVDLVTCPREIVRDRVTVIPQEPVLLSSMTLRDNLTGFTPPAVKPARFDDPMIFEALQKVQLRTYVESYAGGLDTKIDDIALSAGQKQLICLARAIIMKRKILLLDEATSNVDEKTNELMQRVIRTEFTDSTIIAIAHRVHSLTEFDIIAVVDEGRIVEYGSPGKLLSRPESLFCRFYDIQRSATYEY
ncbi:hypothetical protein ZTR_07785 [Talaromyces verruculosus]|nr:hypothetical protein ZTR_07785 [Talaromyces verruculosus]